MSGPHFFHLSDFLNIWVMTEHVSFILIFLFFLPDGIVCFFFELGYVILCLNRLPAVSVQFFPPSLRLFSSASFFPLLSFLRSSAALFFVLTEQIDRSLFDTIS